MIAYRAKPRRWGRAFSLLLLILSSISGCSSQTEEGPGKPQHEEIYGQWVVSGFGFYPITIYSEGEAEEKYLGKSIVIDTVRTIILGDTCIGPRIVSSVVYLDSLYTLSSRVSKEELGLHADSALVVDLFCTGSESLSGESSPDYRFIYADKSLSIEQEGALFHLKRK